MSTNAYKEVLNDVIDHVDHLSPDEQMQLLGDLNTIIRRRIAQ
ncbi:MAG TPA: hypothetical protein VEH81_05635 [Ktedonobacteraceae bacterium]|nr:hypothetical protein [Ktedonobacteraceae bacterium]